MTINYSVEDIENFELQVRSILGVPEELLTDEVIDSPLFISKANKYINRNIKDYSDLDENLLQIALVYYVSYLLCPGMYARLPKQMGNVSTKTVLQDINWDEKALEMLDKANETLDRVKKAIGIDYFE